MFYLIGNPLAHSWSVPIHRQLADYEYELHPLLPEELDAFMRARDFSGLNVTIPYKQDVIPYCDALTDTAARIGAVNTIYFDGGRMIGHNTDYAGFDYLAKSAGISFAERQVFILGSGGTSLTARTVAADSGAASVRIVSRSGPFRYEDLYAEEGEFVLINTTPVGMYPNTEASPVDLDRLPGCIGVIDVIYNPLRTRLVQAASARGIPAAGGLPMLVAQAAFAAEHFAGHPIPQHMITETLNAITAQCENIVLIGMPGCGKSTVGALLADMLGRELVDTDAEIVAREGRSIPEIFAAEGESGFRAIEKEVVTDVGRRRGLVIACGGGAVLDPANRIALRQNGRIYRLLRPLEALATDGRPLSDTPERLQKLAYEREPIYSAMADLSVDNIATPEQAAGAILRDFTHTAE